MPHVAQAQVRAGHKIKRIARVRESRDSGRTALSLPMSASTSLTTWLVLLPYRRSTFFGSSTCDRRSVQGAGDCAARTADTGSSPPATHCPSDRRRLPSRAHATRHASRRPLRVTYDGSLRLHTHVQQQTPAARTSFGSRASRMRRARLDFGFTSLVCGPGAWGFLFTVGARAAFAIEARLAERCQGAKSAFAQCCPSGRTAPAATQDFRSCRRKPSALVRRAFADKPPFQQTTTFG